MAAMRSKTWNSLLLTLALIIDHPIVVRAWISSPSSFHIPPIARSALSSHPSRRRPQTPPVSSSRVDTRLASSSSVINNNVVLRPSSDPSAFDSAKVGSVRVHRYIDSGPTTEGGDGGGAAEDETSYVMWYHGRSREIGTEDGALPPLSTGRIGRAISKNGLAWEKDTTGSVSEDREGACLGKNNESWWGFDTAHVGLGQVLLPMTTPAVMTDGGVYLMYYMGGSYDETDLKDYMDVDSDATIKGMKMKIGVALSQDGITWGRVEGDDSTGACVVPYDSTDSSQYIDPDYKSKLEEELYCGWPDVVVDAENKDSQTPFVMYYSTMLKDTKEKCIAYAVSTDGFRWSKRGVCLRPGGSDEDEAGCARCSVVRMASLEDDGWKNENGWIMFYEGVSKKDGKHRVMRAESEDRFEWKKTGIVLDVGEKGAWDESGVGSPHVIRLDDGCTRMYYTGQDVDGNTAIGISRAMDEKTGVFNREQAQFTFAL